MPRLQAKSFATSDEVPRQMPKMLIEAVSLDDATVSRGRMDPGWRFSIDVGPTLGTSSCPLRHLGYSLSGAARIVMGDGQTLDVGPDTVFDIPPGHDAWVIGEEPWVFIEWGATDRAFAAALGESVTRSFATILFTDIVDSTARLDSIGDAAWRDLLAAHNERLREQLNIYRGREVKTTGDGVLAVFDSPARAARCAFEMTRSVRTMGLEIRVGLNTGEIELVGDDVRGVAVHAAARILGLAGPGEVLVSSTTAGLLEGSGIELEDAGVHELKGLQGPRQVFRLVTAHRGGSDDG
jgi:class 3 adenylate cyclase